MYTRRAILPSGDTFYGTELQTGDATSRASEADSTGNWTTVNTDVMESQSSVVNGSSYALHTNANSTPTNTARVYLDLNALLTEGDRYRLSIDGRHVGSGGLWRLGTSSAHNAVNDVSMNDFTSTDTTFATSVLEFTYAAATNRYLVCKETSAGNDGGVYLDNLSIKRIL